ncbi:uncharacterized protein LOC118747965 [Rhagoletis pomonella]|uniref:uncharacterized protein LOC118747965 n=1 Tax=Rhagoletis pomonella TaxID=28610 RepID=UPI00177E41C2|nr:uncharacterized protein LOC118747965 [Rhagoletis pomonella]
MQAQATQNFANMQKNFLEQYAALPSCDLPASMRLTLLEIDEITSPLYVEARLPRCAISSPQCPHALLERPLPAASAPPYSPLSVLVSLNWLCVSIEIVAAAQPIPIYCPSLFLLLFATLLSTQLSIVGIFS